jgi:hypothetical protein
MFELIDIRLVGTPSRQIRLVRRGPGKSHCSLSHREISIAMSANLALSLLLDSVTLPLSPC